MVVPIAPSMMAMRSWSSSCSALVCNGLVMTAGSSAGFPRPGAGLVRDGANDLKVRFLDLARDHLRGGDVEPRPGEKTPHGARRKSGVALAVAGGHLRLAMFVEAEEHEATARPQDAGALRQGAGRMLRVGQRVEHDCRIERAVAKGEGMHVGHLGADGFPPLSLPAEPLARGGDQALVRIDAGERAAVGGEHAGGSAVA